MEGINFNQAIVWEYEASVKEVQQLADSLAKLVVFITAQFPNLKKILGYLLSHGVSLACVGKYNVYNKTPSRPDRIFISPFDSFHLAHEA